MHFSDARPMPQIVCTLWCSTYASDCVQFANVRPMPRIVCTLLMLNLCLGLCAIWRCSAYVSDCAQFDGFRPISRAGCTLVVASDCLHFGGIQHMARINIRIVSVSASDCVHFGGLRPMLILPGTTPYIAILSKPK